MYLHSLGADPDDRPGTGFGRGDDTVGNPHRAHISQFEFFELSLTLNLYRQTVPCRAIRGNSISVSSTLPLPPLKDLQKQMLAVVDRVVVTEHFPSKAPREKRAISNNSY